jgi:exopolyphosphatase/guanosine-5'-triphosphate,3'-diphosphate pyrophosphatase
MATIAAVDIGSNGIRLSLADTRDGEYEVIHTAREAIRLGLDVFSTTAISDESIERSVDALKKFRSQIDHYSAKHFKAVATSAVREASNRDRFLKSIEARCGIKVQVIGGEEEAYLVYLAARDKLNFKNKRVLLIDIGGGSVEISLAEKNRIIFTESYPLGSVRLIQMMNSKNSKKKSFDAIVADCVKSVQERLEKENADRQIDLCVATGGSVESFADLRRKYFGQKDNMRVTEAELTTLIDTLQPMTLQQRIEEVGLRPDRADVIVPAGMVLRNILQIAGVDEVHVPGISLREGLLGQIATELQVGHGKAHRDQVTAWAYQLGRKYSFDERHATVVAKLALEIYDQTQAFHELEYEERLLLEVAALLHDLGHFVNVSSHHKHTYYLIKASPLIGLTAQEVDIVANVTRYHRKSLPSGRHLPFNELPAKDRSIVTTLAAILRVADALDCERTGNVESVRLECGEKQFLMRVKSRNDLALVKWALSNKADLFKEVFQVELVVDE